MQSLYPAPLDSRTRFITFLAFGVWIQTVMVHVGVIPALAAFAYVVVGAVVFAFAVYVFRTRTKIPLTVWYWVGFVSAVWHMYPFIPAVRSSLYGMGEAIIPVFPAILPLVVIITCSVGVWFTYLYVADVAYSRKFDGDQD